MFLPPESIANESEQDNTLKFLEHVPVHELNRAFPDMMPQAAAAPEEEVSEMVKLVTLY